MTPIDWPPSLFLPAVFLASAVGVRWLLAWLIRKAILDLPNERSSHSVPTPRGGGLAVMGAVLLAWCLIALRQGAPDGLWTVILGAGLLMGLSWVDDRRSLPALPRFLIQAGVVALGLSALPPGPVFQDLLPFWLDRLLAAIGWLWFVNLYNFMDGIDGITGVETVAVATGIAFLSQLAALHPDLALLALSLSAAAIGFLVWNWHPARIFLGDVGSVPLGFLLGWLLLTLAAQGLWAGALILPAYYLADATFTLAKRAVRGEKVWQAHREHFYQQATQKGWSHAKVSLAVAAANAVLLFIALQSPDLPWLSLAAGAVCVLVLLLLLAKREGRA